ncbi:polyprenyl synthetase family protein [Prosthecomicrobium pneumaticum]|uniref:Probable farnesyl diphosphate synthase n=1 Tax=Prosthecomicrobium pneumaticum TaxID=81895 RepID=A0A7W9FMX9_9HYPH|nr:farnesyl diphosphate synthase [Prosthecomicrobium pneumaticum]MBB5753632.1 farnesyl diphosphate synthase [Prosthecomicrobium pneumaticum]
MDAFTDRLVARAAAIEPVLEGLLDDLPAFGELERPLRLMAAMRHAVLGGGKRLRPFLVVEAAALFGREDEGVLRAAAAIELLHCYSLVHDDLPAMDDDDLRRGRPTVHKAYDEATAILAGDALLTLAFDVLADPATDADPAVRAALVLGLARASGPGGMVGGQMLDLEAESVPPAEAGVRTLQAMKTGALLRFSVEAGAILGGAPAEARRALLHYGAATGAAFQLADDLLDATATAAETGKRTGKDAARGKATLVALHGVERSRRMLVALVAQAEAALAPFGPAADTLRQAARFVADRRR